jgi:alkanesulfonate monooxygenase SsuD/methylene tetrahydromethanopterin reductase-like flavin-dependent oxidoreductase (luciferase family)
MELGLFLMPSHPPERGFKAGQEWDLNMIRAADELGFSEAWIGEHFTAPWEPNPSPDILVAQALVQTSRIKLAPGGHLLPYHHPAELACRVAFMDHLAQGRYMLGVAAGGLPSDCRLFCVDQAAGENRAMMREALDIMLKIWQSDGGLEYKGRYWNVSVPNPMMRSLRHHIKPFQMPHPPIGVAGMSPGSDTLKLAGERGFLPMSLNLSSRYAATHWDAVEEGAARTGLVPRRSDWRMVRETMVADTDEEAYEACVNGAMGDVMSKYLLPLMSEVGMIQYMKDDPGVSDDKITSAYLADHGWLVGSVRTVTQKLEEMYKQVGGFGTLLMLGFDYADDPGPWMKSMRLMATEVIPRLQHLTGGNGKAS